MTFSLLQIKKISKILITLIIMSVILITKINKAKIKLSRIQTLWLCTTRMISRNKRKSSQFRAIYWICNLSNNNNNNSNNRARNSDRHLVRIKYNKKKSNKLKILTSLIWETLSLHHRFRIKIKERKRSKWKQI